MTPAVSRLMKRVEMLPDAPGCWLWTGAVSSSGYGVIGLSKPRGVAYTHRVAYEAFVGQIPNGLVIDHLCRVRACCNPGHLEAVTDLVNVARGEGWNARRTTCRYGHPLDGVTVRSNGRRQRYCRTCNRLRVALAKAEGR